MENETSETIRVHPSFKNRVDRFIEEFEKLHKIKISTTKATKIIDDKIEEQGGLIVD